MALPVLLGIGFFLLFTLFVGARLLLLARRTGGLPELAIGLACLCSGFLGMGLQTLGDTPPLEPRLAHGLFAAGRVLVHVGILCQALFTWRVFRPERSWAATIFWGGVAAVIAISLGGAWSGTLGDRDYGGLWFRLQVAVHVCALAWGAFESLLYWTRMRRRLGLGLADPVVTNRFLVGGMAIGFGALAVATEGVLHVLPDVGPSGTIASICGSLGAISILGYWLTFFPPRAYCRWLTRHAPEAERV
jgi:hypothetical protein